MLDLPNWRCARLSSRLVVAHFAVNHGARCLSHLLGLVTDRRVEITSSTPASVAWSIRNFSTRSALTSFVVESLSIMAWNAAANSSVEEKSFQSLALMPYVARQSPVRHRYRWWALGSAATAYGATPSTAGLLFSVVA
jgi:hypothetical protein